MIENRLISVEALFGKYVLLTKSNSSINKEIYISIGELSGFSWAKVKILSEENWLLHIWEHGNHEIIVLNDQKNKAICLLEEEYFWEMYILSI